MGFVSTIKSLRENNIDHCHMIKADDGERIVYVRTEDDKQVLIYEFDVLGHFEKMHYEYVLDYETYISDKATENALYGTYTVIRRKYGNNKAKINF